MDDNALGNAGRIIERFGGIRPMAKKIDVAVTTIQGWKKRDVIPGTRREQVLQAAAAQGVDLSDILLEAPGVSYQAAPAPAVNEGQSSVVTLSVPQSSAGATGQTFAASRTNDNTVTASSAVPRAAADIESKLAETEKRAVKKSAWINVVLILLAVASGVVLLWPASDKIQTLESDVGALRGDVDAVKAEQSFLSTLIPRDLDQRIMKLQQQAAETQQKVTAALTAASEISQDVLSEDAGTVGERAQRLGEHLKGMATPQMASLIQKIETIASSAGGAAQLDQAVSELSALVSTAGPVQAGAGTTAEGAPDPFAAALTAASGQSTALGQVFEGVPPQDMKAAALLLGMTQFRESLNRDNTAFEDDMQLLIGLVGEDDPALVESLQRLAPQAESGVLTPGGLTDEFKTMAGEAVVASLKGEDVSIQERARARMNEVFAVEKDGELLTGTPEQATMARAENLLQEGKIEAAISEVETLQGPAADVAAPWLDKARATLNAQNVEMMLDRGLEAVASGQSRLFRDDKLGINVLKREGDPLSRQRMNDLYQ